MRVKNSQEAVDAMKKTAPDAIDAADMADGTPNAGTRSTGKSVEPGPHKYRFSQTTPVTQASVVPGAHEKAVRLQEGCNLSSIPKALPPGGDKKEE